MRRDQDGDVDMGLLVGLVIIDGGWAVGIQLGRTRCSLDGKEARALGESLIAASEHLRLGTVSMLPAAVPANSSAEVVTESLAAHRRVARQ
jgi:hypothetical protein